MKKGQGKIDEFAFVLLAGIILLVILMLTWGVPSEAPPFVQPTSVNLAAPRNATSIFELNITGKLSNVTLSATGEIKNWISFDKNRFDVIDSTVVKAKVRVPFTSAGTFTTSIIVESLGGKQVIPVAITVTEQRVTELSRSMLLGDFSVSYSTGTETLDSKENFEVSSGYFSSYSKDIVGSLTEEQILKVSDGYIQLLVDETNSAGNLIVLFNGKEVLNKIVGSGEIIIPIDKTQIERTNTIAIKAGPPGWRFWMSNVYRFRTAKFVVNYKGVFSKDIPFILNQKEIDNFDHFQLTFRVKNYSFPLPQLLMKVNGQLVFSNVPPLGFLNTTFKKDILENSLILATDNMISFLFEQQASYEIDSAILTVYYTSLD